VAQARVFRGVGQFPVIRRVGALATLLSQNVPTSRFKEYNAKYFSGTYRQMYISRTNGVLFALVISLLAKGVSAQGVPQSADSLSQISAAPTSEPNAQILLTVSDNMGNPASALAKDSVQLRVGGQPVEIKEIRSLKDVSLFFSVLVDLSGSSRQFADQQIAATSRLFRELSTGNNHGYLVLFKSEIATSDRFLETSTVEETLRRFPAQARSGGTALYDAIVHAATEQLSSSRLPRNSRRAIFILSDGGDNTSHKSLAETLKVVQNEGIPVFSIGFSSYRGDSPRQLKRDLETLKTLSDTTGGLVSFLDQPGDVVGLVARLMDGQCLLSFKPEALRHKKSYPLKIEYPVNEFHVLAPTEYFPP
jgi:Ca-activated chloride channel homolog